MEPKIVALIGVVIGFAMIVLGMKSEEKNSSANGGGGLILALLGSAIFIGSVGYFVIQSIRAIWSAL